MSHPGLEFMDKYMRSLAGRRILEAGAHLRDGQAWPYFIIEEDEGWFLIEVSQDAEGNGPGFLTGLPLPQEE